MFQVFLFFDIRLPNQGSHHQNGFDLKRQSYSHESESSEKAYNGADSKTNINQ